MKTPLRKMLDSIPRKPLEFLRRVAESHRIRTATDDFDPTIWGDAITRVIQECRFEEASAPAAKPVKTKR